MKKAFFLFSYLISLYIGKAQSFQNPILAGYYPDPSICRAGDNFYIVNSSFAYYPGLPLFHSKDLLNWELVSYALNRSEQLNLDSAGVSRGLFAPSIAYHDGLFYIVCTEVSKLGNFVITAKDPKGPWSNPVSLPQVNGIDPSLFFDNNGKSYIVYNSIPPDNISIYNGHRTIRLFEFDAKKLKVIGEEKIIVNGGTDLSKKPVWIEGPHIFQKDGYYYLICAEGGTGYNHSEVVFRSSSLNSPFIPYQNNPILTQRHLDPNRKNPITTTGHADFVEGKDGKWWAVFLGCRPYEGDYYNTGRETFMAPIVWRNGWPEFDLGADAVQYHYPIAAKLNPTKDAMNGNYLFHDDFNTSILNLRYQFLRTVRNQWYSLTEKKGSLVIDLQPATCAGKINPSFIGFHQPHIQGYAACSMNFTAKASNEKSGLLIFQNETNYYYLCKSVKDGQPIVELFKGGALITSKLLPVNSSNELFLKIKAKGATYAFYYATTTNRWMLLADQMDAKFLSTKTAGGFVGCLYSLYATSNELPTTNKASYNWFEVKNNDEIYK